MMVVFTASTVPTKPSPGWRTRAWSNPASSPDTPTANGPWTLMADTMSRLTRPTSTMRAMSRVSASVTRRPSTNVASRPSRFIISPICGPPPWTTTGRMPTECISTTSAANPARWSPPRVLPPYFTTTVAPENRWM